MNFLWVIYVFYVVKQLTSLEMCPPTAIVPEIGDYDCSKAYNLVLYIEFPTFHGL